MGNLQNSNLNGTKIPQLTEMNGSMIKAYYDDGKRTMEIFAPKGSSNNSLIAKIISVRTYKLLPAGFDLSSLIIPGAPSAELNRTLSVICQAARGKYPKTLNNATLAFASQLNSSGFILMFKNEGYL
jgi:hypothetical protein